MILTGKAAEYAEKFEKVDREVGFEPTSLTEKDQIDLLTMTMMFERDEGFKYFMSGCQRLYAMVKLSRDSDLMKKLLEFAEVGKCLSRS